MVNNLCYEQKLLTSVVLVAECYNKPVVCVCACQVDYRGYEVTVENFIRVLTGRLPHSTPGSKRLLSDDRSNILIYMTGHGGDGFLKFQVC